MQSPMITKLKLITTEMRVWQWTKNVLVFAPIIFGAKLFDVSALTDTILVFLAMSFAASTAYVINDLFDINEDRKHPVKKNRPIASGGISKGGAYVLVGTLLVLSLGLSLYVSMTASLLVGLYLVLNLFYSKVLKHMAIMDILIVAFFYIYRVYLGGVASDLQISGWLILTTFFVALFMITGKRRAEIVAVKDVKSSSRKVLALYNEKFLDAALIVALTLFNVFYALYAVLVQHNELFILTIFPIIYISLRYLYLIFFQNKGEEPEKLIFTDKELLAAGVALGLITIAILYASSIGLA